MKLIDLVEKKYLRTHNPFRIGDTVDVHVKIVEGNKERVQIFNGTVISLRGHGTGRSFTVRRIVAGEGVERVFPLCSPRIVKINVKKRGRARRAKLYYLRDRVGKGTRLREIQLSSSSDRKNKKTNSQPAEEVAASTSS